MSTHRSTARATRTRPRRADALALANGPGEGLANGLVHGLADGPADGLGDGPADGLGDGPVDGLRDGPVNGRGDGLGDGPEFDPAPGHGGRIRAAVRLAAVGAATALVTTPLLTTPVKTISSAAERATSAAFPVAAERRPLLRRASDRRVLSRRVLVRRAPSRRASRLSRNKATARTLMNRFGWRATRQYRCLEQLWAHESHWNEHAHSPSGAHGIPQALPGAKMAIAGPHWESNPQTQIRWGLRYIRGRYGAPCTAWAHWQAAAWY
ncbi:hypothetical protein AB0L06_39775 [Spirillospora sp. NPDC052269]